MKNVVDYSMNNCGYCTSFKPEWNNFTAMVDKLGSSALFNYATYNISNANPDGARANKFKITGTPTIIITDKTDDLVVTYNGDRNATDLMLFVNNNIKTTEKFTKYPSCKKGEIWNPITNKCRKN